MITLGVIFKKALNWCVIYNRDRRRIMQHWCKHTDSRKQITQKNTWLSHCVEKKMHGLTRVKVVSPR
jgi:hypothetical protein